MTISDYADFMNSEEYKNFVKVIASTYNGLYSDQELAILIQRKIMSEL